jgi:phospholipid/cholesterol/gamma-HCH transport system substrate-binding protein
MEREANYAAVGAFVVAVIALAFAFIYWYTDARDAKSYVRHEIYFEGSVSGLNVGSTVRYLGVDVGRVVALNIDKRSSARVQVIADIDESAPVSAGTVAELSFLGVTGLLYIDLLGSAGNKTLASPVESERYPVIRSVRSGFDIFLSGVPEVMGRASDVAQRASRLLSDDNIDALSKSLVNIEAATRNLPEIMREVDLLAREVRSIAGDLAQVSIQLRQTTETSAPALARTVQQAEKIANHLASTSARIDRLVISNADAIDEFAVRGLPELESLLREARVAAVELQDLSRTIRDEPSRLIIQPAPRGIEVPR